MFRSIGDTYSDCIRYIALEMKQMKGGHTAHTNTAQHTSTSRTEIQYILFSTP